MSNLGATRECGVILAAFHTFLRLFRCRQCLVRDTFKGIMNGEFALNNGGRLGVGCCTARFTNQIQIQPHHHPPAQAQIISLCVKICQDDKIFTTLC